MIISTSSDKLQNLLTEYDNLFLQTIGCTISLFLISPKLTIIMLGVVPIVIVCGTTWGSMLRKLSREAQEQISKSTAVADEALGNVRTVRAFAMEQKEFE